MCRREAVKLYLKGERCYGRKCPIEKRPSGPGERSQVRRKVSEYAIRLREKQKLRRIYGILERQFKRYFAEASREKGVTGAKLLELLERRLDNVVYRMGLASSRAEARELVRHGHFAVNGRKTSIPSFRARPGDVISVREASRSLPVFKEAEKGRVDTVPGWLEVARGALQGTVLRLPSREDIDVPVQEHLIVELYSR